MAKIKQPLISLTIPGKGRGSFSFLISRNSADKIINVLKDDEERTSISNWGGAWCETSYIPNLDEYLSTKEEKEN